MTTELKPFTLQDLAMTCFNNHPCISTVWHDKCWDIRESTYVVEAVYKNILKDIKADPTKKSYSYTVSNFRVLAYKRINDIALPKIASLFPDFQVEGTYTYDGGDPERETGDPYFDYEVKVTIKQTIM
jgi:hypothetical protein